MDKDFSDVWNNKLVFKQRHWSHDVHILRSSVSLGLFSRISCYVLFCGLKMHTKFEDLLLNHKIISKARKYSITLKVKSRTFWGEEMFLVYPEFSSVAILRSGFYEEGLTRIVLERLKPNMIFCDVGAHLGYYSLLASFIVGERGQVHAFEPTPSIFNILSENTEKKDNITVNRCALFSREMNLNLLDHGLAYAGHNTVLVSRCNPKVIKTLKLKKFTVPAITLDQYVEKKHISPDFVKIDVENAEYDVLLGMKNTLVNHRPIISLEVGDKDLLDVMSSRELISYLLGYDYEVYEYDNGSIIKHTLRERYNTDNLLFIPKNR